MDGRSLRNDYEVTAFIFDQATSLKLQEIFLRDVREHCFLLTPEVWSERFSKRERFCGRFFSPIRSNF
jgi:phosphatidylserine/phosphatidylglycerophosphate/cardiolipin synthase-like enzyme